MACYWPPTTGPRLSPPTLGPLVLLTFYWPLLLTAHLSPPSTRRLLLAASTRRVILLAYCTQPTTRRLCTTRRLPSAAYKTPPITSAIARLAAHRWPPTADRLQLIFNGWTPVVGRHLLSALHWPPTIGPRLAAYSCSRTLDRSLFAAYSLLLAVDFGRLWLAACYYCPRSAGRPLLIAALAPHGGKDKSEASAPMGWILEGPPLRPSRRPLRPCVCVCVKSMRPQEHPRHMLALLNSIEGRQGHRRLCTGPRGESRVQLHAT